MADKDPIGMRLQNPRWEAFCRLFVFGSLTESGGNGSTEDERDPRNNATQAYLAAGYKPRSLQAASVSASRLLRNDKVQQRIEELRATKEQLVSVFLRRWASLLPEAQHVLIDAMEGKPVTRVQLQAALAVIDRAQGRAGRRRRPAAPDEAHPPCIVTVV